MFTSHAYRRHILFISVIIIVAGFIAGSDALHTKSEEILAASEAIISRFPLLGMLLFILLAMVSAMLAFFSSAILVPIGVYAWGSITCFLLLWIGWLLGGVASFGIGHYTRPPGGLKTYRGDKDRPLRKTIGPACQIYSHPALSGCLAIRSPWLRAGYLALPFFVVSPGPGDRRTALRTRHRVSRYKVP